MRMSLAIAGTILLAVFARPSLAQGGQIQTGTITFLDPVSMNFIVQGRTGARQYWATRATFFRASRPSASFFDLTMGQRVEVAFHNSGPLEIADVVTF